MAMHNVVLDTNILLVPGLFSINIDSELRRIFGEYRLMIVDNELKELEKISIGQSKVAMAAKLALKMLEKLDFHLISSGHKHPDDAIVEFAIENNCVVATQDKLLKERIKEVGRKIIILRSKTHFELM